MMERHNHAALAAAPGDMEIADSVWGGRVVAALRDGGPTIRVEEGR